MPRAASDYVSMMKHAIGGDPDSRIDTLAVLNEAIQFIVNCHDWKFRKRPPMNVAFVRAAAATAGTITAIARSANVVTVTTSAAPVPAFIVNQANTFTVAGVTDSSFNGTFALTNVLSTTSATYAQTGANGTSSGGTIVMASPPTFEQFVTLPPDFGELMDCVTLNNAIANVLITSLEDIAWRRGSPNSIAYDGLYRVALSFPGQTSTAANQPNPQLEIWPRPTTTAGVDLTLTYRAGATLITNLSAFPNIPPKLERLLVLTCRLFIQGYEEEQIQANPLWVSEFAMAKDSDGRQQLQVGQLRGGAISTDPRHQVREFQSIQNPASRG